jgi:hypothetical protein
MQRRWLAALLFPLMAQGAAPVAALDALAAIDACIAQLDSGAESRFESGATHCPDLVSRLQSSDWAAWLPPGWRNGFDNQAGSQQGPNNLSVESLAALRKVVVSELALRANARAPQVALLRPLLADLAARNPPPRAWWERLRNRLRVLFAPGPKRHTSGYQWLARHVSPSQALMELVAYATFALVVILAAFIVVNEWCASALSNRRRALAGATRHGAPAHTPQLGWDDLERAPVDERPRMLLELIAMRLTALRRLPASAALTVRELARAALLADAADRERLDELVRTAEELRFAPCAPGRAGVARVLERGRELFERLGEARREAV